MKVSDYLFDKLFSIITFVIASLLSAGLLWLIELRTEFIVFFEALFWAAFATSLLWDFCRKRKYYQRFWILFNQLDDKTLLAEIVDRPSFYDGKVLCQVIRYTNKYMNDRLAKAGTINQEYREYVEMWVHEVKTPITSAHLMVENDKNITTLRIDDELHKIERFVEQALFYARSTTLEKDFKVEKTTLKVLVHEAVKSYSKPIIQANGQLHFENMDVPVFADSKWCVFIIGQIIANSVKYHSGDLQLTFTGGVYESGCYLLIADNGVGIPEADLSRVFDKGFTGENGRAFTKSTGIGLYLCKKLCQKMNMDILIDSTPQKGTTVKIIFPKGNFYFEQA